MSHNYRRSLVALLSAIGLTFEFSHAGEHSKTETIANVQVNSSARGGGTGSKVIVYFNPQQAWSPTNSYCSEGKGYFDRSESHMLATVLTAWSTGTKVQVTVDNYPSSSILDGGACQIVQVTTN